MTSFSGQQLKKLQVYILKWVSQRSPGVGGSSATDAGQGPRVSLEPRIYKGTNRGRRKSGSEWDGVKES